MRGLNLFFLPALAAASAVLEARVCGDNCARAVIASAFTTRHGKADCSSYLLTTVTPATSTIIETQTLSFFPTVTVPVTETTSTTTTVPVVVATLTVPSVVTVTVTSTSTSYTNYPGVGTSLKKRDETVVPSLIPTYASACSGAARYSTACSCVGVFPSTTTAATPLTTSTVYVSVSYTATETSVAATETNVITATSNAVTTTTLVSTSTVTTVATVTARAFRLRVVSGTYAGQYVKNNAGPLVLSASRSDAALFTINIQTGVVTDTATGYAAYVYSGSQGVTSSISILSPQDAALYSDIVTPNCWIASSGSLIFLTCQEPSASSLPYSTWVYYEGLLWLTASGLASRFGGAMTLQLIEI